MASTQEILELINDHAIRIKDGVNEESELIVQIANELKNKQFRNNKFLSLVGGNLTEIKSGDLLGLTTISNYAFCEKPLISVELPYGIETIGESAFEECESLEVIYIPNSLKEVGNSAFYHCGALGSVYFDGTIDEWVSISFDNTYASPTYYANKLYINNELVSQAEINAPYINKYAFYSYNGLTSVKIGDNTQEIGHYAFMGCENLTYIEIGQNVVDIGNTSLKIGSTTNMATIKFLSTTPPSITQTSITASTTEKIIVPSGCGETYRTATNYSKYADIIFGEDEL